MYNEHIKRPKGEDSTYSVYTTKSIYNKDQDMLTSTYYCHILHTGEALSEINREITRLPIIMA